MKKSAEHQRLQDHLDRKASWKKWGPYLSERSWGTVREDYSPYGSAWDYFPHDNARSKAYRWGEDGIAGISDRHQYICFALSLWNHNDPILKERLFGLAGPEGNHGEDVKEHYFYLDATPTHSYLKMLYKYPQAAFPYADLVAENGRRGFGDLEYELLDTGVFDDNRYFDVFVEYAKAGADDILIRITAHNRGPETASLDMLPTIWFRNTWSFGYDAGPMGDVVGRPVLKQLSGSYSGANIHLSHLAAGDYFFYADKLDENEFLSPYGIRSISKLHQDQPYTFWVVGQPHTIDYHPAESKSGLFGGNSNCRGPIWFPINYLLIESLQKYHHLYGESLKVECPTGSGQMMNLGEVATELSRRLIKLFLRDGNGERPIYGGSRLFRDDPHWRDHILFNEYFHGDNGAGLGASHQTGWTGLVAKLIQQSGGWKDGN